MATIYLIHFAEAYKHARHYLGFTDDLDARLERHRAGSGARLMEVIKDADITWQVARTWQGDRKLECQLKNGKRAPRLCAVCAGEAAYKRAKKESNQ
jgi:predicted GIY-YIG superfamily endonuclease